MSKTRVGKNRRKESYVICTALLYHLEGLELSFSQKDDSCQPTAYLRGCHDGSEQRSIVTRHDLED